MNRDRREFRMEDRTNADDEYYKIQLKVEAKIKQEEEKEEEMKRAREHDERSGEKQANDNPRNSRRGSDEGDARRTDDYDRDRDNRTGDNRDHRTGDNRDNRSNGERGDGYRSGENRHNKDKDDLKSEMMKLEKQQAPPDRKPFYNMENSNPSNNVPNNNNWNNNQQQYQRPNNNWNNNQKNNFRNHHQYQNNYEPISEFQSKYQLMANDPSNCKFYMKTGACRFGPRCSRNHLKYENSPTILIPNFFQDARMTACINDKGTDEGTEYDEVEMIHEFEKFYDDVIGEFRAAGNVTMFKCCQNYVQHLRGNVYVQYSKPEYAVEAMKMFNGRYYAGRQLGVELSPVTNWKSSICGLFDKRLCPRGKACNFLHVFRNPGNAYSVPNRTDFDPERAFRSGGYDPSFVNPNHPVFKYYNQRDAYGYRSENVKPPVGKNTSSSSSAHGNKWDNVKNEKSHSRSRSKDREHSSRKRHHSRSRSHSRGHSKSRSHSRSRSRSASRSRRRKHSKSKSHSRSKSRSHSKEKEKEKERSKRSRKHSHSSSSSRGSSKKKTNHNDSDVSDTSTDWSDISLDDN